MTWRLCGTAGWETGAVVLGLCVCVEVAPQEINAGRRKDTIRAQRVRVLKGCGPHHGRRPDVYRHAKWPVQLPGVPRSRSNGRRWMTGLPGLLVARRDDGIALRGAISWRNEGFKNTTKSRLMRRMVMIGGARRINSTLWISCESWIILEGQPRWGKGNDEYGSGDRRVWVYRESLHPAVVGGWASGADHGAFTESRG